MKISGFRNPGMDLQRSFPSRYWEKDVYIYDGIDSKNSKLATWIEQRIEGEDLDPFLWWTTSLCIHLRCCLLFTIPRSWTEPFSVGYFSWWSFWEKKKVFALMFGLSAWRRTQQLALINRMRRRALSIGFHYAKTTNVSEYVRTYTQGRRENVDTQPRKENNIWM